MILQKQCNYSASPRNTIYPFLLCSSLLLFIAYCLPAPAFAVTNQDCQPIYGGGNTCNQSNNFTIDKKILNPQTGGLVDNLSADSYKFVPGEIVSFQITIKNISNNSLSNLTFKDIFPNKYLNFYSGPAKFDNTSKTMTLTINTLNKDESKDYTIRATVANPIDLRNNQTICLSNQAQAIEGTQISQDNSQFCITPTSLNQFGSNTNNISSPPSTTKGGLPIYKSTTAKRAPSTGPEDIALYALAPTGILGWFLRKKTKFIA